MNWKTLDRDMVEMGANRIGEEMGWAEVGVKVRKDKNEREQE